VGRVKWALNASKVWKGLREGLARACTDALAAAMARYDIDFITHPNYHYPVLMGQLADAAARTNTAIEINSAHGLPKAADLRLALKRDARFVIGSDAHRPENVGNFATGLMLALEAGIPPESILNSSESSYTLKRGGAQR